MEKHKEITKNKLFIKYSIFGFLFGSIFVISEIIGSLINPGVKTLYENITFALIVFIPMGLFISTYLYWYIEFHLPKKREGFLSQETFLKFKNLGFLKGDGFIEGDYKGFHFVILWSPISVNHGKIISGFSSLIIEISCEISDYKINPLKKKYKKEVLTCETDGIANNIEIYFSKPKFEKILLKMDNLIKILNENGVKSDI